MGFFLSVVLPVVLPGLLVVWGTPRGCLPPSTSIDGAFVVSCLGAWPLVRHLSLVAHDTFSRVVAVPAGGGRALWGSFDTSSDLEVNQIRTLFSRCCKGASLSLEDSVVVDIGSSDGVVGSNSFSLHNSPSAPRALLYDANLAAVEVSRAFLRPGSFAFHGAVLPDGMGDDEEREVELVGFEPSGLESSIVPKVSSSRAISSARVPGIPAGRVLEALDAMQATKRISSLILSIDAEGATFGILKALIDRDKQRQHGRFSMASTPLIVVLEWIGVDQQQYDQIKAWGFKPRSRVGFNIIMTRNIEL
jgi:hypothetical protein